MFSKLWQILRSPNGMATVTLVSILLGVYGTFFWERRPDATWEVLAIGKAFDIRTPLADLDIQYLGKSLRASNEDLYVISLRFRNTGRTDIPKANFDESDPLGIELLQGRIVSAKIKDATNKYLKGHVTFRSEERRLLFAPVILDAGDAFSLDLVLLTPVGVAPTFQSLGKIVGVHSLAVAIIKQEEKRPFTQTDFWVILSLFIGLFLALVLFVFVDDRRDKKRRNRNIELYKQGRQLSDDDASVLNAYLSFGMPAVETLYVVASLDRNQPQLADASAKFRSFLSESKLRP
jgi:hypothetical protein